jgi:hypothetical protein
LIYYTVPIYIVFTLKITGSSTPPSAELTTLGPGGTPQYKEIRQIMQMHAEVLDGRQLRVQLQLDDQMNRQLTGQLRDEDTPESIVAELVQHGFVSEVYYDDSDKSLIIIVFRQTRLKCTICWLMC